MILFPFPGLVVLIGRPLVILRQPAALLALLLRFSVHQSQALASLVFVGGVVELHAAPQPSSSWATLELCWRMCKTTQLRDLTNTHALDFFGGECVIRKKTKQATLRNNICLKRWGSPEHSTNIILFYKVNQNACWALTWLELEGERQMMFAQLAVGSESHIGGLNEALG